MDADSSHLQSACVDCKRKIRRTLCIVSSMGFYHCVDCYLNHSMEAVLNLSGPNEDLNFNPSS